MNLRACGLAVIFAMLAAGSLRAVDEPARAATPVPAAVVANPVAAPAIGGTSHGGTLQLAIYFVLLLSLLGGGMYVMRNGLGFLQPKPKGPRKLEISETRMLGNRQFLIVAEYEQRKMLIGVCPGRIDYLCTLAGPEPEFPKISVEEEA